MSSLIAGLFNDSKAAGEAVSNLKEKGYTKDISVIAKDMGGGISSEQVKKDKTEGAVAGAVIGGPLGALAGLVTGAVTATVPGAVLLVAGPLAAVWGVTGTALGALGGGLVGALVQAGFPEEKAKAFQDSVYRGEVLLAVTGQEDRTDDVVQSLNSMGAVDVSVIPQV